MVIDMTSLKMFLKKEKKNLIISLAAAVIVSLAFTVIVSLKTYADNIQSGIAEKIVRLHIVANSNSDFDQDLKLKVRDGVLDFMRDKMKECKNREESIKVLEESKDEIKAKAESIIFENNCYYSVNVRFEKTLFPVKSYDGITLPSGMYDAVRIDIGEAKGQNWWCVMYPSLCIYGSENETDSTAQEELKNILSNEEYSVIADRDGINFKFAAVEAVKKVETSFNGID